jgi:hypothetical protein
MRIPPERAEFRFWRDCGPALALLIVSAIGIMAGSFSPTGHYGQYAVLAPPWYDFAQTVGLVDRAGGTIVGVTAMSALLIVHSDQHGFVRALYRAGAWLVVDPGRLRGCLGFERDAVSASRGK